MARSKFFSILAVLILAFSCPMVTSAQGQAEARDDTSVAESADNDEVNIGTLIRNLNADDYQTREDATQALIERGAAAREHLEKLAADPPSAEVKVRLQKIFRELELTEIRRNAVKLEQLFDLIRRANEGDLDRDKLAPLLTQLVHVINTATGEDKWNLPIALDEVHEAEPATSLQDGLVVMRRGRITSLQDSIVLADVAVDITSARNSIIIARATVNISSPRNCLVIAGYDARVSSARDSVVISGRELNASIARDCVLAAQNPLSISIAERTTLINSKLARQPARDAPEMKQTEGFTYPQPPKENPLADKIQVTYASGDVVLFRRTAGGGELVARLDQPVQHPDGGMIEELAGWKPCYCGQSRYAVFSNGERFVLLPVLKP